MVQITSCQTKSNPNLNLFPTPKPVKAWNCRANPWGMENSQPNHLDTWYHIRKNWGQEKNRCTDDSDRASQKTQPTPPTGSGTPRLNRLLREGILSRRSCHEKIITLDGAQDFQTLEIACNTSPSGAPVSGSPLKRVVYADFTEHLPLKLWVQDHTSSF